MDGPNPQEERVVVNHLDRNRGAFAPVLGNGFVTGCATQTPSSAKLATARADRHRVSEQLIEPGAGPAALPPAPGVDPIDSEAAAATVVVVVAACVRGSRAPDYQVAQ
ncbi:hypothetical protein GWI33_022807 [Rhynchophorus ferrugineus]|uniref:Uncharacterized protein n=1 Tax=Rhynchophorus ferrugineus TaxID=354439 RepID=A0A834IU61_RHYFE|nr:hypothetical protein GWI33_022807 [Rhynchophorus ferrugineus]